ncbi:MAG: GNAT family N-acetyltransferase [Bacteroidota bacterium]
MGFAFLPDYIIKGYALEASKTVLDFVIAAYSLSEIFAVTVPENVPFMRLLKRLGLVYKEEIEVGNQRLSLYNLRFL